jgi:integrase
MARLVRHTVLETRTSRSKLKPRAKPYWRSLDPGLHLGYRKGKNGGAWVVRRYIGNEQYQETRLGVADDFADADGLTVLSFAQAQEAARRHHVQQTRADHGLPDRDEPYTVEHCREAYLQWMEQHRRSGDDARARANALILPVLGDIEASKLTASIIQNWLVSVAATAPRLRTRKGESQRHRIIDRRDAETVRRRRATANRTLTVLKAALNRAWRAGNIADDSAWRRVEPFENADAARIRYLTTVEARRLINACPMDFRQLVQAALATGARYGELIVLRASDYHADSDTLHIRASKTGKGRHVYLTAEGKTFFTALASGKAGDALLLAKANGSTWDKSHQARPMSDACTHAKILPAISFHGLRHTYASLAVMNGAPLLVVAKNLGHSDTRMVEKHYGHLAPSYIADAIRDAAPRFGFNKANVRPLRETGQNGKEKQKHARTA